MASPYTSQSATGYNSNPPSDDGSATTNNQMKWAGVKTKIGDPVKGLADNINSQLVTAFTKVLGGGGITSVSTDYTIQATDQGKLVKATAGLALTLGDATAFLAPFIFGFLNLSGAAITVSGAGGQTIDGNASFQIAPGAGFVGQTDGANWFTLGLQGTLVGKQLMYGDIINGTLVQSNTSNAVTFALKTLAGADPSSSDPVIVCFRNATVGTGNYVYRAVTAATSVVVSSGSTLGTSNNVPCKIWVGLLDNAGTVEMFVINCLNGTSIYPLKQLPIITTTAEGGSGGADSAGVPYSTAARTSAAYLVLGYAEYTAGLATAGSWNTNPTNIQLYGPGVPLPGGGSGSLLHCRHVVAANTADGALVAAAFTKRSIGTSTTVTNDIIGASLASDVITLPAGTYYIEANMPVYLQEPGSGAQDNAVSKLRNTTDSADVLISQASSILQNASATRAVFNQMIRGRFTLTGTKTLELQTKTLRTTTGGFPLNTGVSEVYSEALIWKLEV